MTPKVKNAKGQKKKVKTAKSQKDKGQMAERRKGKKSKGKSQTAKSQRDKGQMTESQKGKSQSKKSKPQKVNEIKVKWQKVENEKKSTGTPTRSVLCDRLVRTDLFPGSNIARPLPPSPFPRPALPLLTTRTKIRSSSAELNTEQ